METKIFYEGPIPEIAHPGDAGIDLKNAGEDFQVIGETLYKIHTGVFVEIPKGRCGVIFERSGLGSKGFTIHGRIIDSGYRGEIVVLLSQECYHYFEIQKGVDMPERKTIGPVLIKHGDKIAQMVIVDVYPEWIQVASKSDLSSSERGERGLGSSGR